MLHTCVDAFNIPKVQINQLPCVACVSKRCKDGLGNHIYALKEGGCTKPGRHGPELVHCNEIRLCAKNIITMLDSTTNTIGKAYVTTKKEIGI